MYVRCMHIELISSILHESLIKPFYKSKIRPPHKLDDRDMYQLITSTDSKDDSIDSEDSISPLPPPLKNVKFPMVSNNYFIFYSLAHNYVIHYLLFTYMFF